MKECRPVMAVPSMDSASEDVQITKSYNFVIIEPVPMNYRPGLDLEEDVPSAGLLPGPNTIDSEDYLASDAAGRQGLRLYPQLLHVMCTLQTSCYTCEKPGTNGLLVCSL